MDGERKEMGCGCVWMAFGTSKARRVATCEGHGGWRPRFANGYVPKLEEAEGKR